VDADYVREHLAPLMGQRTPAEIDAKIAAVVADIASKTVRPPAPLSQSVDQAPHPWFGLGTHPDIVTELWAIDETLPQSCRWLVWGFPALVHPQNGVIFAFAFGTIGIIVRLPLDLRAQCPETLRAGRDIGSAGEDWRFLPRAYEPGLCRAAYDAVADDLKPRSGAEP
jgi:hypothetical protein